jgi:hypothetical protein
MEIIEINNDFNLEKTLIEKLLKIDFSLNEMLNKPKYTQGHTYTYRYGPLPNT